MSPVSLQLCMCLLSPVLQPASAREEGCVRVEVAAPGTCAFSAGQCKVLSCSVPDGHPEKSGMMEWSLWVVFECQQRGVSSQKSEKVFM